MMLACSALGIVSTLDVMRRGRGAVTSESRSVRPAGEPPRRRLHDGLRWPGFSCNDAFIKSVAGELPLFQAVFLRGLIATALLGGLAWQQGALALPAGPARPAADRAALRRRDRRHRLLPDRALQHADRQRQRDPAERAARGDARRGALLRRAGRLAALPRHRHRLRRACSSSCGRGRTASPSMRSGRWRRSSSSWLRDLATRRPDAGRAGDRGRVRDLAGADRRRRARRGSPPTGQPVGPRHMLRAAVAAVCLIVGYIFGVMTMRIGEIGFVQPFRYTLLVWAMLFGIVMFGEWPDALDAGRQRHRRRHRALHLLPRAPPRARRSAARSTRRPGARSDGGQSPTGGRRCGSPASANA